MGFIVQSIDVLWLVVALAIAQRTQRPLAAGFFIASMIMMRLLIELMDSIGHPRGLIGLLDAPAQIRGQVVYSIFYILYILFLYIRPQIAPALLLAASISVFFMAAVSFTVIMVL